MGFSGGGEKISNSRRKGKCFFKKKKIVLINETGRTP